MNFPTLETLEQRNLARIQAAFPDLEPQGKGILEVMARMHASAMHLSYGMIDWHTQQLFPQTATGQFLDNLLTWRPLPRLVSQRAEGRATVTGAVGSRIRKGSIISGDNGQRYQTLAEVTLCAANQVIAVRAVEAGSNGDCENEKGKWEQSLAGMSLDVLLNATGGTDSEDDEAYRARALETIQRRGRLYGKRGDYAAWAVEASAEIVRAWEVPNFENKALLGVLVAGNDLADVSDGALENAKTALERNKLAGVLIDVLRAQVRSLDFRFTLTPNTPDLRVAVTNGLRSYIVERQKPACWIVLSRLTEHLQTNIAALNSISILAPSSDISTSQREIPAMGTIVWV